MKISQRREKDIEIVEVQGEINFHSSPELREKLIPLVQKEVSKILVTLKRVSYIDSSGLATFVEALQKIKRYNGRLVLSDLSPAVLSVFEIAKLDGIFSLAGTEEDAWGILNG